MTNFELMRQRLESRAGIADRRFSGKSYEQLMARETADGFADMMNRRMVMGALRYSREGKKETQSRWDVPFAYIEEAARRVRCYEATGNLEHLVDAANFLRLEFRKSRHPRKHFKAIDRS